jgi:hypothetical protein
MPTVLLLSFVMETMAIGTYAPRKETLADWPDGFNTEIQHCPLGITSETPDLNQVVVDEVPITIVVDHCKTPGAPLTSE